MKAIFLAAGYATRLRPLTDTRAKPLLPIAGRPMIERLYEKTLEVPEIDGVHVVTNHRFADAFERWARDVKRRVPIMVHDDGTSANDTRLGAIGDVRFTIAAANLQGEDLMVLAGDNLFEFSLADYTAFWRNKARGSAVALFNCPNRELVKEYSAVDVDGEDRITAFEEKPKDPKTSLVAIATYIYRASDVARIDEYLDEGHSPDQPGNYVAWLHRKSAVYGWRFSGDWLDIGNHEQLRDADNRWRTREGLPVRDAYSPA